MAMCITTLIPTLSNLMLEFVWQSGAYLKKGSTEEKEYDGQKKNEGVLNGSLKYLLIKAEPSK